MAILLALDDLRRALPPWQLQDFAKRPNLPAFRLIIVKKHIFYLNAKDLENFAPLKTTNSLHFEPGSRFEYSNPAFNGLALKLYKQTK